MYLGADGHEFEETVTFGGSPNIRSDDGYLTTGSPIDMGGRQIAKISYLEGDSSPVAIGSGFSTNYGLSSEGDLGVGNKLEVAARAYFRGIVWFKGSINLLGNAVDNVGHMLGNVNPLAVGGTFSASHVSGDTALGIEGGLEVHGSVVALDNIPTSDPATAGEIYADSADGYTLKQSQG